MPTLSAMDLARRTHSAANTMPAKSPAAKKPAPRRDLLTQLALADIREPAELAASSRREACELTHRRVTENIDDLQQLLRK